LLKHYIIDMKILIPTQILTLTLILTDYRRVTVEADLRNIILRKFLERCGLVLESIIRKHRIINNRNRDTAVYVGKG
jgi:hypothetical protein